MGILCDEEINKILIYLDENEINYDEVILRKEIRKRDICYYCETYGITCDDTILLMNDEKWKQFTNVMWLGEYEDIIKYLTENGISFNN